MAETKEDVVEAKVVQEPLQATHMVTMSRVGHPVPSRDGTKLAFSVKKLDYESKKSTTSLYLYSSVHDSIRRVTNAQFKSDSEPVWLDDQHVAFLSNRSGSSQLWYINVHGGEAQQLSQFPIDVETFKFNTVGSYFVFSARIYTDIKEDVMNETASRDEKAKELPYKKYTKLMVRHWDSWADGKRSHLFVQRVKFSRETQQYSLLGLPQDILPGFDTDCPVPPFGGNDCYDISPTGDEIAFVSKPHANESQVAWSTKTNIYLVSVGSTPGGLELSEPRSITDSHEGAESCPQYSPSGKLLSYMSMERAGYEADLNRLILYNRSTQQHIIPINQYFDQWVTQVCFSPTSTTLYLVVPRNARSMIFHMEIDKNGQPKNEPLPLLPDYHNSSVCMFGKQKLAFLRDSFDAPAEIYTWGLDGTGLNRVTNFNTETMKRLSLGQVEEFYVEGADNDAVHSWFIRPANFEQGKQYPMVVIVHGGPQSCVDHHWHYRWNPQFYASNGFAVLSVNFHGSTSFGQKFIDSIRENWGTRPFEDIMKAVDHTLRLYPWVDVNRIGALGASYGGFMMNWINGHTDRFRCLVNHCGLFDQLSMYFGTEELFFPECDFQGTPWTNREMFEKFSPQNFVEQWKTPTLVIHGGKDFRVPYTQGLSTFTALQRRGVPSELLYFPDEGHWVLNPFNSVTWHENVLSWLNRWLNN
eukprot:TRINITY_DN15192_c0_g3_i1.p1 TRINITY_DN15192_c0_g3~~TRINITY_DN15192_c0_g3_i1.p1  ORF type:complete len:718 (-),score=202.34 TRINITY_DN15192_c0_g3_i1:30-2117(-)